MLAALSLFAPTARAQLVTAGSALTPAALQPTVDSFRATLGPLNPNDPISFGFGRREINWDGVPESASSPNAFPADFFNGAVSGRARGVNLSTPGTGFQVSAGAGVGVEFANINPAYPALFQTFSPLKLFTPIDSTITDVTFFVPGSTTPALTRGFGSVFTDVDLPNVTSIQFFDAANSSLGTYFAPSLNGDATLSFLGVTFASPVVSRVRITSGNASVGPGLTPLDVVVMDDWVYGEPVAATSVPDEGSSALLLGLGCLALGWRRRPRSSSRA